MTAFDEDTYALTKLLFDTSPESVRARHGRGRHALRAREEVPPAAGDPRHRAPRRTLREPRAHGHRDRRVRAADDDRERRTADRRDRRDPAAAGPLRLRLPGRGEPPDLLVDGRADDLAGAADGLRGRGHLRPLGNRAVPPFLDIRDAVGTLAFAQISAQALPHAASAGLLKEVNTYSYRTPDYLLSTAQDYRKGSRGDQYHSWQATFGTKALVFTTHPGTRAPPDARLERRWRAGLLDRHRVATAHRAARERRDPSLRAAVRRSRPGVFLALTRYEPLHARVLPAGSLRRGRARRQLDLRPQRQRLHRALFVAARGVRGPRPETSRRTA